jgi:hypothetical protein
VPRPTPRHRRKAGSGPPAAALIAWIGTDPRRCDAATAEGGRKPDLRPPARFRSTRNVAAGVALVCGAILAVMASTTEAVLAPREATTPPVIQQDHQAAPPIPAQQVDPNPVASPPPAATQQAVVRQAPQSIPVPPVTEHTAQTATPAPAEPTAAVRRVRTQPEASAQRRVTIKPDVTSTSPSTQASHSSQNSPSDREARSGLGSTLDQVTEPLGSTLGLR